MPVCSFRNALLLAMLASQPALAAETSPQAPTVIASVDLSTPFKTRSPWQLTVTQGPPVADTFGAGDDQVPGAIALCLAKGPSGPCDPQLQVTARGTLEDSPFNEAHELNDVRIVHPRGPSGAPMLLIVTSSLHSGDGDQLTVTRALAYRRGSDQFVSTFHYSVGHNNNQEVRYIEAGRLVGDIVTVEAAETAPFGFWVSVNALTASHGYQQVLRYRSSTIYADGNPLAVIDSEMANIQRRLGLWRPGKPLPLPAAPCPRPHLIRMELWCE